MRAVFFEEWPEPRRLNPELLARASDQMYVRPDLLRRLLPMLAAQLTMGSFCSNQPVLRWTRGADLSGGILREGDRSCNQAGSCISEKSTAAGKWSVPGSLIHTHVISLIPSLVTNPTGIP
jgi:hypothetical protein